jgi:hypothetical protein
MAMSRLVPLLEFNLNSKVECQVQGGAEPLNILARPVVQRRSAVPTLNFLILVSRAMSQIERAGP